MRSPCSSGSEADSAQSWVWHSSHGVTFRGGLARLRCEVSVRSVVRVIGHGHHCAPDSPADEFDEDLLVTRDPLGVSENGHSGSPVAGNGEARDSTTFVRDEITHPFRATAIKRRPYGRGKTCGLDNVSLDRDRVRS